MGCGLRVEGFRKRERPRSPGAGPSIGFAWNSTFRHQFRIRARAPVVRPKLRHHQNWTFVFIKLLSSQNGAHYNTPPIFDATSFFTFFGLEDWVIGGLGDLCFTLYMVQSHYISALSAFSAGDKSNSPILQSHNHKSLKLMPRRRRGSMTKARSRARGCGSVRSESLETTPS